MKPAAFLSVLILAALAASPAFAGGVVAPEIDATSGTAALALLGGGLLVLRSRRAKR